MIGVAVAHWQIQIDEFVAAGKKKLLRAEVACIMRLPLATVSPCFTSLLCGIVSPVLQELCDVSRNGCREVFMSRLYSVE
jgi:hypothetical protein